MGVNKRKTPGKQHREKSEGETVMKLFACRTQKCQKNVQTVPNSMPPLEINTGAGKKQKRRNRLFFRIGAAFLAAEGKAL